MKRIKWQIILGISLIALSTFIYLIDYLRPFALGQGFQKLTHF